jgi:hypothetical protein
LDASQRTAHALTMAGFDPPSHSYVGGGEV